MRRLPLKWVLQGPDSRLAEALVRIEPDLLIPDFWLGEATNVLQVRRKLLTPDEARAGLDLPRELIEPAPTVGMDLHEAALDIGITVKFDLRHPVSCLRRRDGASGVVASDGPFVRDMRADPDQALAAMLVPLDERARTNGVAV